ncbi:uncharacterized protein TNCV_79851 [Trichonephila clavipes]|nr:uncharacterized protein TNCV_79851 [Trichonephila clavipes]
MRDFTYTENTDMHYVYDRVNGNGRVSLQMYHAQFHDQQMPDHRVFQRLHRQLRETSTFHVTRHAADRRSAVRRPTLEEIILNVVSDRPESSTRSVAHDRVQALNPADYLLRLPVNGTAMCAAAGLHDLCAQQL